GFSMVRYTNAGQLDTSFGTAGVASTTVLGSLDNSAAVTVLPDDSLILSGTGGEPTDAALNHQALALARFTPGGALDTTFGTGGKFLPSLPGENVAGSTAVTPTG